MSSQEEFRDAVNRALFRLGGSVLPRLTPGSVRGWSGLLGTVASAIGTEHIDQGHRNVAKVIGRMPSELERAASVRSWARMFMETLAVPGWDARTLRALVDAEPEGLAQADQKGRAGSCGSGGESCEDSGADHGSESDHNSVEGAKTAGELHHVSTP